MKRRKNTPVGVRRFESKRTRAEWIRGESSHGANYWKLSEILLHHVLQPRARKPLCVSFLERKIHRGADIFHPQDVDFAFFMEKFGVTFKDANHILRTSYFYSSARHAEGTYEIWWPHILFSHQAFFTYVRCEANTWKFDMKLQKRAASKMRSFLEVF
jgi:hypothetical protein